MLTQHKADYDIDSAIRIFSDFAANFTEIAPCKLLDSEKKLTALTALCISEPYQPVTEFKEVTLRKAKILINYGARDYQKDDYNTPWVNAIWNSRPDLNELFLDLSNRDDPERYSSHYTITPNFLNFLVKLTGFIKYFISFLNRIAEWSKENIKVLAVLAGLTIYFIVKTKEIVSPYDQNQAQLQLQPAQANQKQLIEDEELKRTEKPAKPELLENKNEIVKDEEMLHQEFLQACDHGNLQECKITLRQSFLNSTNSEGDTGLLLAVKKGRSPVVEYLLGITAIDVNTVNQQNKNTLLLSCEKGFELFINLLISLKPLPRLALNEDSTVVLEALVRASNNDLLVKSFLKAYVDSGELLLDLVWGNKNDPLLIHLVRQGFSASAEFIIQKIKQSSRYPLFNQQNLDQATALLVACELNYTNIANNLLTEANNLKTNLPNYKGETPVFMAIKHQQVKLAINIIKQGGELKSAIRSSFEFIQLTPGQRDLLESAAADDQKESKLQSELPTPPPHPSPSKKPRRIRRTSLPSEVEAKTREQRFNTDGDNKTVRYSRRTSLPLEVKATNPKPRRVSAENNQVFEFKYLPLSLKVYNKKFLKLCVNTLKYLAIAYVLNPEDEAGKCSRRCQLVIYLLNLLKIINNYQGYLKDMYLDKTRRQLINDEDLRDFINAIDHGILPLLMQGAFSQAIENIVKKIINDMPQLFYQKIINDGTTNYQFNELELKEVCKMLGNQQSYIDIDNLPTFLILETSLYENIYDFHHNFLKLGENDDKNEMAMAMIPVNHRNYVLEFALPVISQIYSQISFETEYQYITSQKPTEIIHWEKLGNFVPYWHQLTMLLISCGDICMKKTDALTQFIIACRELRNLLLHGKGSLINLNNAQNEKINQLCKTAKDLHNNEFKKDLDRIKTECGQEAITDTLRFCGLFNTSITNNEKIKQLTFEYMNLSQSPTLG